MKAILAVLILFLAAGSSTAATAIRASVEQLAGKADLVVRARCLSSTARFTDDRRTIRTDVVLETLESIVGAAGSRLTVACRGGRVGDKALHVRGQPTFAKGEEVVVFLRVDRSRIKGAGVLRVLGWSQGKFRIERSDEGKTATAVQDLTGLCFVRRNDGTPKMSLKPDRLPLGDLVARVRKVRPPAPPAEVEAPDADGGGTVTPEKGDKDEGEAGDRDRR